MSTVDFLTPLTQIAGFGEKRCALLRQMNIVTAGDFLSFFPCDYLDTSSSLPIAEFHNHPYPKSIRGTIQSVLFPQGTALVRITLSDTSGEHTSNLFVHHSGYRDLRNGVEISIHYDAEQRPDYLLCRNDFFTELNCIPRYGISQSMLEVGITQDFLRNMNHKLLNMSGAFPERLPRSIEDAYRFESLFRSFSEIHFPRNLFKLRGYYHRVFYERCYQQAIALRWSRKRFACPGVRVEVKAEWADSFSFDLSESQLSAINSFHGVKKSGGRVHSLFCGAPATGKTVAALIALCSIKTSGQQIWVCRSERALDYFIASYQPLLDQFGIVPVIFSETSSLSEQRASVRSIKLGEATFVVTTESLLERIRKVMSLATVVMDRPDRWCAIGRKLLHHWGLSFDLIVIQDHQLSELEQLTCGDLTSVHFTEIVEMNRRSHRGVVESSKVDDLFAFIRSRRRGGAKVLFRISDEQCSSEQIAYLEGMKQIDFLKKRLLGNDVDHAPVVINLICDGETILPIESHVESPVVICRKGDELRLGGGVFDILVVVDDGECSERDLSLLQREYVKPSADSWLFLLRKTNCSSHLDQSELTTLFHQAVVDLEKVLILE